MSYREHPDQMGKERHARPRHPLPDDRVEHSERKKGSRQPPPKTRWPHDEDDDEDPPTRGDEGSP